MLDVILHRRSLITLKIKDAIEKYIAPECVAQWRRSKALGGLGSKSNLGACYRAWEAQ